MSKRAPTLRNLKARCWKYFSEYIRRKHADEGGTVRCISCGALKFWKEAHAGHFIGGRTNSVLFNEDVVYPQCLTCNIFLSGNYGPYTLKMIDMHGREKVEQFMSLKHQTLKYTRADLEALIDTYKKKLKELEQR